MEFRRLKSEECELIKNINASQYIKNAWREIDGKRRLVEINYQDPDWPNGYEYHLEHLRKTIMNGGAALGVFDHSNKLIAFGSVNRELFGEKSRYVLLDQLFISLEHRNKGIGRTLFQMIGKTAKEWSADKLYICAGSAEETIAFYFAMGCKEAEEIQPLLYNNDPRDYQLEFIL
ncbi:GNAT family N-acetyltransferase [Neobacillus mesonae]|nr:GNAT family N-acetyltransferase [Neobacillus mesonae]